MRGLYGAWGGVIIFFFVVLHRGPLFSVEGVLIPGSQFWIRALHHGGVRPANQRQKTKETALTLPPPPPLPAWAPHIPNAGVAAKGRGPKAKARETLVVAKTICSVRHPDGSTWDCGLPGVHAYAGVVGGHTIKPHHQCSMGPEEIGFPTGCMCTLVVSPVARVRVGGGWGGGREGKSCLFFFSFIGCSVTHTPKGIGTRVASEAVHVTCIVSHGCPSEVTTAAAQHALQVAYSELKEKMRRVADELCATARIDPLPPKREDVVVVMEDIWPGEGQVFGPGERMASHPPHTIVPHAVR